MHRRWSQKCHQSSGAGVESRLTPLFGVTNAPSKPGAKLKCSNPTCPHHQPPLTPPETPLTTGSLRTDARAPGQPRPLRITPGFIPNAEGSALIEAGNTHVICTATVQ